MKQWITCSLTLLLGYANGLTNIPFGRQRRHFALHATGSQVKELRTQVVVVGAGVSGLVCARTLISKGINVQVFEAGDGVGGRVRTDVHDDGYLLDRGFQVFLEEYPTVKQELDYERLQLKQFLPGALVWVEGALCTVADPIRRPQDIFAGVVAPVGSLLDKARLGLYRCRAQFWETPGNIFERPEQRTSDFLSNSLGLTDVVIDRFFRPFYQGIFLAPLEQQSSRMFEFVFTMFSKGAAALPRRGLQAVPDQLSEALPPGTVELSCPVASVETGRVVLADGRVVECDHVVVATDGPAAAKLLNTAAAAARGAGGGNNIKPVQAVVDAPVGRASTCLYFAVDGGPPVADPILILNGEGATFDRPVNNVCFPSTVQSSYAPAGKTLASVTVVDSCVGLGTGKEGEAAQLLSSVPDEELATRCAAQLADWFCDESLPSRWTFLRAYRIPHAQPGQNPADDPGRSTFEKKAEVSERIYCCGDHRSTATLNGAFDSGKRAAEAILAATSPGA